MCITRTNMLNTYVKGNVVQLFSRNSQLTDTNTDTWPTALAGPLKQSAKEPQSQFNKVNSQITDSPTPYELKEEVCLQSQLKHHLRPPRCWPLVSHFQHTIYPISIAFPGQLHDGTGNTHRKFCEVWTCEPCPVSERLAKQNWSFPVNSNEAEIFFA